MNGFAEAMSLVSCTCGGRAGYTYVNGWWVCAICRLPRRMYLEGVINGTVPIGRDEIMGLIYFEGGPLDGSAYETKTLLGLEAINLPVLEYVWTSETKVSERTGAKAQVWRHQDQINGAHPVNPPVPQPVPTGAALQEAQSAVQAYANEASSTSVPTAGVLTEQELDAGVEFADTNSSATAPTAPQGGQTTPSDGLPSGDSLFARRKALKLSVGAVVDACNGALAHSKIGSIEKGTGKRVKPEEVRLYAETLARLEAQRGGASARS